VLYKVRTSLVQLYEPDVFPLSVENLIKNFSHAKSQ
jgi:hypothetical protein